MSAIRQRVNKSKAALSSWEGFKKAARTEASDGFAGEGKAGFSWSNSHMDPTPIPERTWHWWNFGSIWFAYGFSPGVWSLGSSMITNGLTPGQAVCCIFLAHLFGAVLIVFNSRFGATYHMGFPVYSRISFGMWGSFLPILLRCALGILWVGVLVYQGGYFVNIMLRCMFGHKWYDVENTLPTSSGTTSKLLLSAMIFWIITVPATFLPVHKTRHFWIAKVFILPPCVIGLFIYTQIMSGDTASTASFPVSTRVHGSKLSWVMLAMINSAMGKTSSLQANQPDLARYAYNRSAPAWSQLICLPVFNTCVSCFGIFATSSVYQHWGKAYWNPWDLLNAVLDHNWNAGARCAVFLCAFGWALSCFVSNIAANVMPFGADITALFPRWCNINRGQFLAYCIGIIIQPWYILASATSFLTFLAGYSIFFGPIAGISAVDYFYARNGNVDVPACFDGSRHGPYMYTKGVHWRAMVAYFCGLAPTLPGFAGTLGQKVPIGATHIFQFGWLFSITTSSVVYFLLTLAFPHVTMKEPRSLPFEQWADDQVGILDRERIMESSRESMVDDEKAVGGSDAYPVREA